LGIFVRVSGCSDMTVSLDRLVGFVDFVGEDHQQLWCLQGRRREDSLEEQGWSLSELRETRRLQYRKRLIS
jgi:hypothetical protein